jgi:hypothetical protein
MKKLQLICLLLPLALAFALSAAAQEQEAKSKVLGIYYPNEMLAKEHLVTVDGQSVYKFENTNDAPYQVQLLKIIHPPLSNTVYEIFGKMKYDNVQGAGYLEMWSYFPPAQPDMPEGQYFSRTLGDSGGMEKISGTCDWRDFSLPFDPTGASGAPTRLEINLILPGRGTVYLSPVKLRKYAAGFSLGLDNPDDNGSPAVAGWWSPNAAPWVGGIGGPLIGLMGGLLGWLSQKGIARTFVLTAWKCCIVFGLVCLIATVIAVVVGQPWFVAMPLCVFGVVSAIVFSATWPSARKRYDEVEIRRMASMDVP